MSRADDVVVHARLTGVAAKTHDEIGLTADPSAQQPLVGPNYHKEGDDLSNVNATALGINVKAIAYATGTLAYDTSMVNGKTSPGKSGKEKKAKKVKPNVEINRAAA